MCVIFILILPKTTINQTLCLHLQGRLHNCLDSSWPSFTLQVIISKLNKYICNHWIHSYSHHQSHLYSTLQHNILVKSMCLISRQQQGWVVLSLQNNPKERRRKNLVVICVIFIKRKKENIYYLWYLYPRESICRWWSFAIPSSASCLPFIISLRWIIGLE